MNTATFLLDVGKKTCEGFPRVAPTKTTVQISRHVDEFRNGSVTRFIAQMAVLTTVW